MIREYESKDLAQCAAIFKEAFSEEAWGCIWTQERAEAYISDFTDHPKFIGFVSEENGVIDGAVLACRKVSWNNDEIHIDELIVDPQKQRSGIGGKLVDAVKEYSKNNGLAGIVLYTAEQAPAKNFYEKNDFQVSDGVICMCWVKMDQKRQKITRKQYSGSSDVRIINKQIGGLRQQLRISAAS